MSFLSFIFFLFCHHFLQEERNAELLEVQRLEAEAARKFAEKKRRVAQEHLRKKMQANLKEKVAARSFAKNYLAEMNGVVFGHLEAEGAFYDPVKKEVETSFMPWLLDGVVQQASTVSTAQALCDDLLTSALQAAVAQHAAAAAQQAAIEAKKAEEEAAAQAKKEPEAAAKAAAEGEAAGDEE